MDLITTAADMRAWVSARRAAGHTIGFVPTLGCLHDGHATLMRTAGGENDATVASAFVNPIQFRREKFEVYPRDLDGDHAVAAGAGVAALFAPSWEEMYPDVPSLDVLYACQDLPEDARPEDAFTRVRPWGDDAPSLVRVPRALACRMDGALHPWHFDGVATVVARLFELVPADRSYFGAKDPQQVAILSALNAWLGAPTSLQRVPTIREPDGLAASSRNTQLPAVDRPRAVAMASALRDGARALAAGDAALDTVRADLEQTFAGIDAELDYVDLLDPDTLDTLTGDAPATGPVLMYLAYYVDGLRLTDTWLVEPGMELAGS